MRVLAIGASTNIGYHACFVCYYLLESSVLGAERSTEAGHTVIFMMRSTGVFNNGQVVQPFVASGQAKLIKGDALKEDDLRNAWDVSGEDGPVDVALFTVGSFPRFLDEHALTNLL